MKKPMKPESRKNLALVKPAKVKTVISFASPQEAPPPPPARPSPATVFLPTFIRRERMPKP